MLCLEQTSCFYESCVRASSCHCFSIKAKSVVFIEQFDIKEKILSEIVKQQVDCVVESLQRVVLTRSV